VLLLFLAVVARGMRARSSRTTVLEAARGRAHVGFALQTFIIVGGVLRLSRDRHHLAVRLVRGLQRRLELRDAGALLLVPIAVRTAPNQLTRRWTAMALIVALITARRTGRRGRARACRTQTTRSSASPSSRCDGLILAPGRARANRIVTRNGKKLFFRSYPQGRLAAHVVGYSTAPAPAQGSRSR
jgi:hypothetical protein